MKNEKTRSHGWKSDGVDFGDYDDYELFGFLIKKFFGENF